ncbi:unnamed protein product [Prorocentrum cordatum]|uniref:NADP-dependent oxidoreductase domain-containing protein n=1 Tax=Prorocentrum cordatum TaxID=2364126 RepID=A0ABN9R2H4_9DINO|nr:unnamed protein product [Polarella glacialis]
MAADPPAPAAARASRWRRAATQGASAEEDTVAPPVPAPLPAPGAPTAAPASAEPSRWRRPAAAEGLAPASNVALRSGVEMPALGLGTRQLEPGGKCQEAVRAALRAGYRLVDTAAAYGNEEDVGNAVRGAGLRREDVFRAGTRRPRWRRGGAGGPAGLPEASRDELRGSVPGPQPEGRLPAGDVGRDAGDEGEGPGARCGRGELRRGPPAEPRRRRARDARGQPGGAALPEGSKTA